MLFIKRAVADAHRVTTRIVDPCRTWVLQKVLQKLTLCTSSTKDTILSHMIIYIYILQLRKRANINRFLQLDNKLLIERNQINGRSFQNYGMLVFLYGRRRDFPSGSGKNLIPTQRRLRSALAHLNMLDNHLS